MLLLCRWAAMAQMVEPLSSDRKVPGSIPNPAINVWKCHRQDTKLYIPPDAVPSMSG